jgi:microcystin-dependent protein
MQTYIGEIRMFGGNFAPSGWALCNGQLMAISDNAALFDLIGTTYGGDGQSTFALPDLQGRFPMHQGTNPQSGVTVVIGERSGTETVTLTVTQIPAHTHPAICSSGGGNSETPVGNFWATDPMGNTAAYTTAPDSQMLGSAIETTGGSPHDNMKPFLAVNFIISLFGIFPSQS